MRTWLVVLFSALVLLSACSDDPTNVADGGDSNQTTPVDDMLVALADSIRSWDSQNLDVDELRNLDFSDLRNGFEDILNRDPGSGVAHLGLALVDLMEVNAEARLWALVDDLARKSLDSTTESFNLANPLRDGVIGHQFRILAEAPLFVATSTATVPENLTIAHLQEIIHEDILPHLDSAIDHLEVIEADEDFYYLGTVDGENFEIDLGEIYFFDASLHALRAGLRLMTGYNYDLPGVDGTYNWVEDLYLDYWPDENPPWWVWSEYPLYDWYFYDYYYLAEYERIESGELDELHVRKIHPACNDSLVAAILQDNVAEGSDFLCLRSDVFSGETELVEAGNDLHTMLELLQDGLAAIRAEDDYQGDDIIKLGYLTDLDADVSGCTDCPTFAQSWQSIEDVIAWVQEVLSGPYRLQEEIDGQLVDVTIDLFAWLTNPPDDLKNLLPYHDWLPRDQWVERETYAGWTDYVYSEYSNPEGEYNLWTADGYIPFVGIEFVRFRFTEEEMANDFIYLTDESGTALEDGDIPYFPDYTFGGLFPGLTTQQAWIDLLGLQ